MAKNPHIVSLNKIGQSIWYDNLSRDILKSGELVSLISQGVSGLTSNPSIFKKSIADTSDYDTDVRALSAKGLSSDDLCEELMIQDVAAAADLLRPIYDESQTLDGYASIEVSPTLAHDTEGTIAAAKRIWNKLARPNIMIKIPATKEGLPAIQKTLLEGINVNITLIFSVDVYNQVAEAFISSLEERSKNGKPIRGIASVASFFVSRVDAICEKKFDELVKAGKVKEELRASFFGKVGIANSKLAYEQYELLFGSPRFTALRSKGAQVQRPLWASTGTKNPALSPVLYIEELAGKDTVNTTPPATLKALLQNMTVEPRLHKGLDEAKKVIAGLEGFGLNFSQLVHDLQVDGVRLFAEAYADLVASIETKKKAV